MNITIFELIGGGLCLFVLGMCTGALIELNRKYKIEDDTDKKE